ncbi:MAG: hypothetical protein KGI98_14505 [Euryarchaeota archaeon]|nr:hypothetical protein [Euryarchaeota archaeon]MDE1881156.1 hypothetical protein [Euryarchaeota archaeon]
MIDFDAPRGPQQVTLRPDVLRELRLFQRSVGASDYSDALSRLLRGSPRSSRPAVAPLFPGTASTRRGPAPRGKSSPEPCRHKRCSHELEARCTADCRRPGRYPKGA